MNIIALADKKWGIGKSGRVLVDIPEDKKLFREETYGKVVVMGRVASASFTFSFFFLPINAINIYIP